MSFFWSLGSLDHRNMHTFLFSKYMVFYPFFRELKVYKL